MGCIPSKENSRKTAEDHTSSDAHCKQRKFIEIYISHKHKPEKIIMKKLKKFRPGLNIVDEVSFENERSFN